MERRNLPEIYLRHAGSSRSIPRPSEKPSSVRVLAGDGPGVCRARSVVQLSGDPFLLNVSFLLAAAAQRTSLARLVLEWAGACIVTGPFADDLRVFVARISYSTPRSP